MGRETVANNNPSKNSAHHPTLLARAVGPLRCVALRLRTQEKYTLRPVVVGTWVGLLEVHAACLEVLGQNHPTLSGGRHGERTSLGTLSKVLNRSCLKRPGEIAAIRPSPAFTATTLAILNDLDARSYRFLSECRHTRRLREAAKIIEPLDSRPSVP